MTLHKSPNDSARRCEYASEYTWWEPLLREGVHYIRTDMDQLESTMLKVSGMLDTDRDVVAKAGRAAAHALFSPKSVACYSVLAARAFAQRQQRALAAARKARDDGEFTPLCVAVPDSGELPPLGVDPACHLDRAALRTWPAARDDAPLAAIDALDPRGNSN